MRLQCRIFPDARLLGAGLSAFGADGLLVFPARQSASGNDPGAAALECQFAGPTIRLERDCVIAVTGADMGAELDGSPLPLWESVAIHNGQVISLGAARIGARAYIALSGGIDVPPVMGSRSTFHMAGVGGVDGYALKTGQRVPIGEGSGTPGWRVRSDVARFSLRHGAGRSRWWPAQMTIGLISRARSAS